MGTFKSYSLSSFQIYNTVLLTIVTLLYITSQDLTYFITGSLYLFTPFTRLTHPAPPTPTSDNHQSVLRTYELVFLKSKFYVIYFFYSLTSKTETNILKPLNTCLSVNFLYMYFSQNIHLY